MAERAGHSGEFHVAPGAPIDAATLSGGIATRYSICTLMTSPEQYREMVNSFRAAGFDGTDVEYLFLDNSNGNRFDAYAGLNLFLNMARGELIILVHQDVLLEFDRRDTLEARIEEVSELDPDWAVLGNAGGVSLGRLALHISDPHGEDRRLGRLPVRVSALDENFLVVRRSANLALSRALQGFHFYGAALCVTAATLGYSSWAIDFHLRHLSGGFAGEAFAANRRAMVASFRRAWRPRWITTTCGPVYLSGSALTAAFMNAPLVSRVVRRLNLAGRRERAVN
jgi:hypothetical protein